MSDPTTSASDGAIRERAYRLINDAMFTVALQHRRVRGSEPEDDKFVFRWWADLQFLIVALRRVRRAAEVALHCSAASAAQAAIEEFDRTLPDLAAMRNVAEHLEDYAVDRGRQRSIDRSMLEVGEWDGMTFAWLGRTLNIDSALRAAEALHQAIVGIIRT